MGARPAHHDEGMLAYFAHQLIASKSYNYTPQIHGPILFYLTAIFLKFSQSAAAIRVSTASCSVILGLAALLYFRKESKFIAYSVATMLLISPLLIYFSRFLVHTSIVILFNFCFVLSLRNFFKSFKPIHLFLSAAFLGLAFGTSETSYIFVAVLVLFIPVFLIFNKKTFVSFWRKTIDFCRKNIFDLLSAVLIFAIVWLMVYSVGLTNLESFRISLPNPFDPTSGLGFWLKQNPVRLGGQPWFYYIMLAVVYELPALVAFLVYLPRVFAGRKPFELFLVWWTVGSFIGYSWAGEKFPWLFLPSLLPLTVASGYFLGKYWTSSKRFLQIIFVVLLLWTIFVGVRLNYFGSYDTRELPVYVQTPKDFEQLEKTMKKTCQGKSIQCIVVDAKITWPLAWDFNQISRLEDFTTNSQIPGETEYLLVDPGSTSPANLEEKYTKRQVQLRDWWVPTKYKDSDSISDYINYFLYRKIWNDKGGFDINFYEKKK